MSSTLTPSAPPSATPNAETASSATVNDALMTQAELRVTQMQLRHAEDRVAWIQDICAALGAYERQDELLTFVMDRLTRIMFCERATLFLLEDDGEFLWSRVVSANETSELRIQLGEGIAGWVAKHGKSINLKDAYKDPRFLHRYDRLTGFRTESILCQPMRNRDGAIIGVVQALNKRSGWFTVDDESLLSAITNTTAIVIENHRLYLEAVDTTLELAAARAELEVRVRHLDTLYEIQRRISEADDPSAMLEEVPVTLASVIASYGCALTIVASGLEREVAFRRPTKDGVFTPTERTWDTALRDAVLREQRPMRHSGPCGVLGDKSATAIVAAPLIADGAVLGVIELIDRCSGDVANRPEYSRDDERLVSLVAAQIAPAIARRLAAAQRERQGRLSAIGHMLSGVMHDMRTPLTIAQGYLQLMERSDDPEKRTQFAQAIQAQFAHLNGMTKELLGYARGESALYTRTVHLHAFASALEDELKLEFADRGVDVTVRAAYRGDARMDDGKLRRVLFNLARNAREAMPNGGAYTVTIDREGDDLVFRTEDTGVGIPPQIQDRLFEAFVTSGKSDATGLGLAIVKKLVDEHGGVVTFASTPGEGTVFEIRLPVFAAEPTVATAEGVAS